MFSLPVYLLVLCTAYTSSFAECGKTDGITASGVKATQGTTIAADHLPFGTQVKINGHTYTVQDRFGGDYDYKIDVYFDNKEDAMNFGRRWEFVEVLKEDKEENANCKTFINHTELHGDPQGSL